MDEFMKRTTRLKRKNRLDEKFKKIKQLKNEINELIRPFVDNPFFYKVTNFWDCPNSPFGWCAYDVHEDPAWDNCIFCGEPYERK